MIYQLHDVEGFNHFEIAEMQDCTCGNSKSQLHKARRALRGTLLAQAGTEAHIATRAVAAPFATKPVTGTPRPAFFR